MLPCFRQRLWIAVVVVIGALGWHWAGGVALSPADGSVGISLMSADVAWPVAVLVALAAGLPAIVGAVGVAATGGPPAGMFSASAALVLLAGLGGSGRGYLWRVALPGGYVSLIVEALVWAVGLMGLMVAIDQVRPWLRPRLPGWMVCEREAGRQPGGSDVAGGGRPPAEDRQVVLGRPGAGTLGAGMLAAVVGAVGAHVLVRSVDVGQILGGLALAFAGAGLVARLVFPKASMGGALIAPLIVAALAYAYVYQQYPTGAAVLGAMNAGKLTGLAVALPIHYASAGVAGCALGLGIGQGLNRSREAEAEGWGAGA